MTPLDKMTESLRRLLLRHGHFAPIIMRLELVEETEGFIELMRTAYTQGRKLAFHPEFVDPLTQKQTDTLWLHEGLHCALLHCFSQRARWMSKDDQMAFWIAADHVVNNILEEAGFEKIDPWTCDPKYQGWTLEEVFEDVKKNRKAKGQGGFDQHMLAEPGDDASPEERKAYEQLQREWKKALADMVTIAKQRGTLPASLERLVDDTLDSIIPWPRILVDHLTRRLGHTDYTWQRPSRRSRSMGMYLPSTFDQQVDCVVFCFDTSGSMWDDPLLPQGFSEMISCCQQINVKKLILIEADADVAREREIDDATALNRDIKGGGGTSFVQALERAESYNPNLIVYFSDLYGEFPEACLSPLLWVTRTTNVDPPVGEVLVIK